MISLGNIQGLEQGFSSNNREMDETELEEGEACSYHDNGGGDVDTSIDPDVALSYIDEKLQNYLGHFKKDFEGVVSAESLGAKFGIYGSFLPAHRRSPHSRTPPRVQNNITPQSLNTLQVEGGHHNSLPPANVSSSIKQGSASASSASSYAYKPPQRNDLCSQNASTKSIQSMEERTPKSEARDQKTLKVRIKVGSENLMVKKNAAIYSGLGLDGSPASSLDGSPMESEGLSYKRSFDSFESPTHILQIMVFPPLFEGCFLSPLPNDLICLSERPKHLKSFHTELSSKEEAFSGVKSKKLVDKKKLYLQDKKDGKDNNISSPLPLNNTVIDDVSCEELVSNALKLPLLSNAHNNVKDSPSEKVFSDESNKEPLHNRTANIGDGRSKISTSDDGISLKSKKISNIEHTLSGDEKRPKKSQVHGFSTKNIVLESNKDSDKLQKERKHTYSENKARRNEVLKDSSKVKDQYVDVFGDMNDMEVDIMGSPDVPAGKMLKVSENGHTLCEQVPFVVDGNDNWVQCDKCQKWRLFPPGSKVDNLPAEWDCSLMTWLPHRNNCSVSEDESNNLHAPPPDMTAANNSSSVFPNNGKFTSKVRKTSNLSFQDSPNGLSNSIKDKQQLVKDNSAKEEIEPFLTNGIDITQPPKTGDIYQEATGQHKKIVKQRTDCYSDGGDDKVTNRKGKRDDDQEFSRPVKKSKMQSTKSGNNDSVFAHDQDVDNLAVSSEYGYGDAQARKDRVLNSENFAFRNSKDNMSGSSNRKRNKDTFKDSPISTPSNVKSVDDNERSSRKRHRTSKSEGKESTSSKRSGKSDKKSKHVSHRKLGTSESLQKDSTCVNPVVTTTSSSSKVSGSLKVKCKFQEVKSSPVESVSSSPIRILNSDKLASDSKVNVMNDYEGDQSRPIGKDLTTSSLHASPNYSIVKSEEKSKSTIQLTNGNGSIHNVKLENGYSLEATRAEVQLDANVSNSGKSQNQNLKSNSVKAKVKASGSYENSLDYPTVSEEREWGKKVKVDEKSEPNIDKTENGAIIHNKEPSLSKSEVKQEYDDKKVSRNSEVEKSEDKSRQLPRFPAKHPISNGHRIKTQDAPSPLRRDSSSQAASTAIKEAKDLKHLADRFKSAGSTDSTGMYFEAALKFLHGASLLESGKTDNIKNADVAQSIEMYSSTAKLCQFCAHEFEKSRDMANAALAYKCVEVAYLRVIYATRDRHEMQHAFQMLPPGESPSSSASDIDNLNNTANGDKVTQVRSSGSPQLAGNLVIAAKNRTNFSRILNFTQDVNYAMEASRKSRIAFAAANSSMGKSDSKDGITSIKRALDFNFHDVDGLLRLVRLAMKQLAVE